MGTIGMPNNDDDDDDDDCTRRLSYEHTVRVRAERGIR